VSDSTCILINKKNWQTKEADGILMKTFQIYLAFTCSGTLAEYIDQLAEKRQNEEANSSTPAYCIRSELQLRCPILAIYIIAYCNLLLINVQSRNGY